MTFTGLYDIREYKPEDSNFVLATWLRGLYYGDSWFSQIDKDIFMNNYSKIANSALVNPNIKIMVACLKEDQNVILGYSILSRNDEAIVWCFVKSAWRRQGIGKSLIPQSPRFVTHLTSLGSTLLRDKLPNTSFNPFY